MSGACPGCVADPPPWGQARAALRYDDQAKLLILPFKYGDRVETARALGSNDGAGRCGAAARSRLVGAGAIAPAADDVSTV